VKKIDLEEDSKAPAPTDDQLGQITDLVAQLLKLQQQLVAANEVATKISNKIERLSGTDIPEAMKVIGLTMFKLSDGRVVELNEMDIGSYTKDNEQAVFSWLRKNNHGDMIKNALSVQIGKGKEALVDKLKKVLGQKAYDGCVVEVKENIHASTFKAFVREQLAEGKQLPKQIAIFHKSETVIKEQKHGTASKKVNSKDDKF